MSNNWKQWDSNSFFTNCTLKEIAIIQRHCETLSTLAPSSNFPLRNAAWGAGWGAAAQLITLADKYGGVRDWESGVRRTQPHETPWHSSMTLTPSHSPDTLVTKTPDQDNLPLSRHLYCLYQDIARSLKWIIFNEQIRQPSNKPYFLKVRFINLCYENIRSILGWAWSLQF